MLGRTSRPCGVRAVGGRARVPTSGDLGPTESISQPRSNVAKCAKLRKITFLSIPECQLSATEARALSHKPKIATVLSLYSAHANRSRCSDSKHG